MPWGGHPQGVLPPLHPQDCLVSALCPGEGTHKGCYRPYTHKIVLFRRLGRALCPALWRAPTRGAPTNCLVSVFGPEKGTHKGRPYPIQAASRGFVPI